MTVAILTAVGVGSMDADNPTNAASNRTSFFPTGFFGTPQTNRAWLMFDISSIPKDAVVSIATLKITIDSNFLGASHNLHAYRLRRRCWKGQNSPPLFPNTQASWNNFRQDLGSAWSTAGAGNTTTDRAVSSGSIALTSASSGQISVTLTPADIQAWIDGTFINNGLLLQADDESGTTLIRWKTLDAVDSDRPKLEITYTSTIEGLPLTDSLEAYWNGSSLLDKTANAHNLTNNNAVTNVAGKIGNAFHFVRSSSQYLSNNDAALKPAGNVDWTFACWVKLAANTELYTVAAQHTPAAPTGGAGWNLFFHDVDILNFFVAQLEDDTGSAEVADTVGFGASPTVGQYIFLAVRHDAARKFYHVFVNNNTPTSANSHNSGEQWGPYINVAIQSAAAFLLGRLDTTITNYMDGDIDEVGYWTRWLSNTDLTTTLYNSGNGKTFNGTAFVDSEGGVIPVIMNNYRRRRV